MRPRSRYIFSLVFLIGFLNYPVVYGQKVDQDQQEVTDPMIEDLPDSLVSELDLGSLDSVDVDDGAPRSRNRFEIGFDYLKLLTFLFPEETKMEAGLGFISKYNIGINLEAGYGEKTPDDFYKNADYKAYGYYARAGLSYYYPFNPTTNFIIGVKYAMSQYQDEATFSILSSLWDDYEDGFQREDLEASWVELILASEAAKWGNLYFGFTFRLRFLIQADNFDPFEVYFVPGYGRTFDTFVPALNLYVKYVIPFGSGGTKR